MISRSSEYAIRALTFLARTADSRHHLARDMAAELEIPAPFLGKVLQPLVAKGFLHSQRGRSGGFRLARDASEIMLVQIVEAEETLGDANTCLLGQKVCDEAHACPMHDYWKDASAEFHSRLRTTSLQDLVNYCDAHPDRAYPMQALRAPAARFERRPGPSMPANAQTRTAI